MPSVLFSTGKGLVKFLCVILQDQFLHGGIICRSYNLIHSAWWWVHSATNYRIIVLLPFEQLLIAFYDFVTFEVLDVR